MAFMVIGMLNRQEEILQITLLKDMNIKVSGFYMTQSISSNLIAAVDFIVLPSRLKQHSGPEDMKL